MKNSVVGSNNNRSSGGGSGGSSSNKNGGSSANGFLPNSLKFIGNCIRTASTGVRTAGASVAASLSGDAQENKDQVLWASFDKLDTDTSSFKRVLLLGYSNGFQVFDVDDATNVNELVSRRDDPVTYLQMQPLCVKSEGVEGFRSSHPLLLVVADESKNSRPVVTGRDGSFRNGYEDPQTKNLALSPRVVRFYSLRSHNYVHVLRFRSTVYMIRCSPRIVAVGLSSQIYCFDALTLENKFSVLTYPVPQMGGHGISGVNIGYGPMSVGPKWLVYASNNPLSSNTGRLSPQNLTPPGVSPSTSPSSGNLVARYAMESSKQLAAGLINLGDKGYKTISKYCQDLKHDGSSSPVSSSSSWKAGWAASHAAETDNAGTVIVKDFESRAVLSQFRAHTSPISALCLDPSGTLLVTASIHGNNINVFRIMPSYTKNGSGSQSYDWSSSHVHLYKLHRGMTPAVIQDICFSNYSQWISIVSSKGTCHIFVLSPFGGENVLEIRTSHVDGPTLAPAVSPPWWSSASFTTDQFSQPPPASVTLSVVSRIKNSGWLNTVSNAATSAVGKVPIPSGALAAVFHRSVPHDLQQVHALEYLLVYTPSGHVVQYKLLPSLGEPGESTTRIGAGSSVQMLDEDLRVKVEAIQGWDVCRRTDWPEREESVSGFTLGGQEAEEMTMDVSDCEDHDVGHKESAKSQDKSHLYLANAEVQINSGRIPIWQNPKISFYSMRPPEADGMSVTTNHSGGEIEIEKVPAHEVEIRRRDLLPVFDHFHSIHSKRSSRGLQGEGYSHSSSDSHGVQEDSLRGSSRISYPSITQSEDGNNEEKGGGSSFGLSMQSQSTLSGAFKQIVVSDSPVKDSNYMETHSSLTDASLSAGRTIGARISYPSIIQSEDGNNEEKGGGSSFGLSMRSQSTLIGAFKQIVPPDSPINDSNYMETHSSLTNASLSAGRTIGNSGRISEASNTSSNHSDLSLNAQDEGPIDGSPNYEQFFQEGYCKPIEPTEVVTEVDGNNSPYDREKSEESGDNDDDALGGVFSFSEEG